jgi:hypothetical protein
MSAAHAGSDVGPFDAGPSDYLIPGPVLIVAAVQQQSDLACQLQLGGVVIARRAGHYLAGRRPRRASGSAPGPAR